MVAKLYKLQGGPKHQLKMGLWPVSVRLSPQLSIYEAIWSDHNPIYNCYGPTL